MSKIDQVQESLRIKNTRELRLQVFIWQKNLQFDKAFKVNAKVAALRRVRKFIPADVMINIYKAFILPHLEYCAPVLVALSSGLPNKLEYTNQFAIRTLMNLPKTTPYGDLLKMVNIKSLEHRRYTQALILLYKSLLY